MVTFAAGWVSSGSRNQPENPVEGFCPYCPLRLQVSFRAFCVAMAAGNQLVVGSTTAMSGAFFTDLFGSNTADIDVRALLHGYNLMSWDNETGTYQINDSVVAGMAVSRDAQ